MPLQLILDENNWIEWPHVLEPFEIDESELSFIIHLFPYKEERDSAYFHVNFMYNLLFQNDIKFACLYEIIYKIKFNNNNVTKNWLSSVVIKNAYPMFQQAFHSKKQACPSLLGISVQAITKQQISRVGDDIGKVLSEWE